MKWSASHQGEEWLTFKETGGFFERFWGLMMKNKNALPFKALWFPDCNSLHTCFMRFPLDIYFLDADNIILSVHEKVKPYKFVRHAKAVSALELPSGEASVLEAGESLKFSKCQ